MKCISKRAIAIILSFAMLMNLVSCGKKVALDSPYDFYQSNLANSNSEKAPGSKSDKVSFLGADYCPPPERDLLRNDVTTDYIKAAGVFNVSTGETCYAYNATKSCYPASTTKILTAYIVLKYGRLKDKVVISKNAATLPPRAASAGLAEGDETTVENLLYGLMLVSGNDAAIALAEYISGSVEEFSILMNKEAAQLGAMSSNFITPNGIHDDEHYTTVYDLYLIFNEAIKDSKFLKIIKTKRKTVKFEDVNGTVKKQSYKMGNRFLFHKAPYPKGMKILGGKSGTTYNAGKCFVLLAKNKNGDECIYITLGADTSEHLFSNLNDLMTSVNSKE